MKNVAVYYFSSMEESKLTLVVHCHFIKQKNYNFSNYSLPTVFLRNIYERRLLRNGADEEQSMFDNEIKKAKHGRIPGEKKTLKQL